MATEDKGKTATAESAADTAKRGERTPVTDKEIAAALTRMDPEQLRSILAGKEAAARGPGSPKWGRLLESLPADTASKVIDACTAAIAEIDHVRTLPADEQTADAVAEANVKALQRVRAASPAVAAAAEMNSSYRSKPLRHSLVVARRKLEEIHGGEN